MCRIIQHRTFLGILFGVGVFANLAYINRYPTKQVINANVARASEVHAGDDVTENGPFFNHSRWLQLREELLHKNGPSKLFLFSYMRGGSSVAGELFNCDPHATMWYEPGDAFFSSYYGLSHENLPQNDLYFKNLTRRSLDENELSALTNFYTNKFNCNYPELPPESLGHYFVGESTAMDGYMWCMKLKGARTKQVNIVGCTKHIANICSLKMVETAINSKCHMLINQTQTILRNNAGNSNERKIFELLRKSLNETSKESSRLSSEKLLNFVRHGICIEKMRTDNAKCIETAVSKCTKDTLRVVQVNRMKMEDLEPLIQTNPDIRVVHYTRDPRGIISSRLYSMKNPHTFDKSNKSIVREAEFLCGRIREDIRQRKNLEIRYPGVFTHIKYESLSQEPLATAKVFYDLFKKSPPTSWNSFVSKHMNVADGGAFGVSVKNATETARKWAKRIPKTEQGHVNRLCADVIHDLGYTL